MTLTDIAAFVGAAAWLYPIGMLITKILTKPKIKIISEEKVEIGYSTYGPIINILCAISAEKKDAIIEKITTIIKHEDGESHILTWKFLDEIQLEIRSYFGQSGTISKNQPAIALKVNPSTLSEKKIGFHDLRFQEDYNRLFLDLLDHLNFLRKTNSPDLCNTIFTSKEFIILNEFYQKGMYWKEGEYQLELKIYLSSIKEPSVDKFTLHFKQSDIELLEKNKAFLESTYKRFLFTEKELPKEGEEEPETIWNWVYPRLVRL